MFKTMPPTTWRFAVGVAIIGQQSLVPARLSKREAIKSGHLQPIVGRVARLYPAADRSFVRQVLRRKSGFEVTLFPRDDHNRYQRNGWNECDQQGETADPNGKPELKEGEREVDGVPAEAVGPRTDDRRRRSVAWDGRASCPEGANCGEEEKDRQEGDAGADWRAEYRRDKPHRPNSVKHQTECDRAQVNERWTHQTDVCDVRRGSTRTAVVLRITCHAVSQRAA